MQHESRSRGAWPKTDRLEGKTADGGRPAALHTSFLRQPGQLASLDADEPGLHAARRESGRMEGIDERHARAVAGRVVGNARCTPRMRVVIQAVSRGVLAAGVGAPEAAILAAFLHVCGRGCGHGK